MSDKDLPETLLIGIDAGCLPVFERLFEEDCTPNIERICTEGVVGPLESQMPPWTPSAWPSLYTGVNPGKHGTFGFVGYSGYDWHVVSADHVREHALWKLLDERDLTSVVVNVPVTHPPDDVDGAIIPGFIGPEAPGCHPSGLLEEVRDAIGDYRVYRAYEGDAREYSDEEKMAEYRRLIRMRGGAFRYLADRFDPDFGFVQFQQTDKVFHEFGGDDWGKVRTVYETMDEEVGKILDERDPDRVFVASDHGMGKYGGYRVFVNEYLRERGYIETTTGGKGMPSWDPIRTQLREGDGNESWEPGTVERLAAVAGKAGITASRVHGALESVGLADVVKKYVPAGVGRTANEQVDFATSTAYMRNRAELGVRINLAGRDPEGVVPERRYEEVRGALIDDLEELTAPDGTPVFEEVVPSEQYFDGPEREHAVDVITVPTEFDHFLSAELLGKTFTDIGEHWDHRLDGMFAAAGEGIDPEASLDRAHLFDVAPTIMAAMGVPYSDRMDGRVLPIVRGADEAAVAEYPDYEGVRPRQGTDDAAVERRLADLGYLE